MKGIFFLRDDYEWIIYKWNFIKLRNERIIMNLSWCGPHTFLLINAILDIVITFISHISKNCNYYSYIRSQLFKMATNWMATNNAMRNEWSDFDGLNRMWIERETTINLTNPSKRVMIIMLEIESIDERD